MNAFTKIFTATEEFLVTVRISRISSNIISLNTCSGSSVRHIFGNIRQISTFKHFSRSRSDSRTEKNDRCNKYVGRMYPRGSRELNQRRAL